MTPERTEGVSLPHVGSAYTGGRAQSSGGPERTASRPQEGVHQSGLCPSSRTAGSSQQTPRSQGPSSPWPRWPPTSRSHLLQRRSVGSLNKPVFTRDDQPSISHAYRLCVLSGIGLAQMEERKALRKPLPHLCPKGGIKFGECMTSELRTKQFKYIRNPVDDGLFIFVFICKND